MEFNFFSNPHLEFGPGKLAKLPKLASRYGKNLLLITGAESFEKSDHGQTLLKDLLHQSFTIYRERVNQEPSVFIIDEIVKRYKGQRIDVIAAVGGGSVIDAGKAVSAMMTKNESIIEYLEGVGSRSHDGKKIPFIALPTTSGTGSEATKNAVINNRVGKNNSVGKNGFKRSLRHDNFVPDIAIVDPELTLNCPPQTTAACGMDALTQLLESLVSTKGSAMTDSLALGALKIMGNSLIPGTSKVSHDIDARTKISYASYISGLTLANAGLGVVHGFASVIGGLFEIPHGVICGTLLCETTRQNIESLISTHPSSPALEKYAKAALFLSPSPDAYTIGFDCQGSCDHDPESFVAGSRNLVTILEKWTDKLKMPRLGEYGLEPCDIDSIIRVTGQKNNPVQLSKEKLSRILQARL